ncbi:DUF305 domain-containing protein [Cellulomonas sp. KH9]|uniref:DUF305 domain-containing protein n=1 Tax=Cellulomonas sp. KH9 TaxID=1855324 RepID=UPI0008EF71B9|nr:DUF305 domain-containing protein [Cellulomonas sp. KH9]SFK33889.1 Uncharacterized conserved protein, DUF305 family [Cellulomonas sp. KH9]
MTDASSPTPAPADRTRSALGQAFVGLSGTGRAVVALLVLLALVVGTAVGATLVARPDAATPSDGSVEAGFARDMQAHHAQAVELAVLVRDRSDDETLRAIALDILTIQQQQIGQMAAWLRLWGLPAASPDGPMAWMGGETGHAHAADADGAGGLSTMPGWVQAADMAALRDADGTAAERLFLSLMIDHHVGGVEMARYAAEHARHPEVTRLAQGIVDSQSREQVVLQDLLDARGGPLTG